MKKIAIIGFGYSGLVVAREILENSVTKFGKQVLITIYDANGSLGRGFAYGTLCNSHILNVPANKMSALDDNSNHFLDWLVKKKIIQAGNIGSTFFAKRKDYGDYLTEILLELKEKYPSSFEVIHNKVEECHKSGRGFLIKVSNSEKFFHDVVILANGNSADYCSKNSMYHQYISNPWDNSLYERIKTARHIVVIGTGLTFVDIILGLQENGLNTKVTAISRHGLIPRSHSFQKSLNTDYVSEFINGKTNIKITDLVKTVRAQIKIAMLEGFGWHAVIDALRPYSQELWQKMDTVNQKRFLRHIRSYWDVHRHRIAPEVSVTLENLLKQNQVNVIAGRIKSLDYTKKELVKVNFKPRHADTISSCVADYVINATGISSDIKVYGNIFSQMLNDGLISLDSNGLGLCMQDEFSLSGSSNLFAVGGLTRAKLWENIAVPDIRRHAKNLAIKVHEIVFCSNQN